VAHFAELDENNIVLRVIVVDDQHEDDGENWCHDFAGGTWKQTSYNTLRNSHSEGKSPLRKNYAGIGFQYDASLDGFIPSQPYPSWLLDEEVCQWESPVPMPTDGARYEWNEATLSWDEREV
jgi:hypothetical protein